MKIKGFKYFKNTRIQESKKDKFPNIRKMDIDGFTVYIGKDAKSNDYLTFNIAKDDDIWLHAKGVPGSHVVIEVKDSLPTPELIKKVAEVAKDNSKAKGKTNTPILFCNRKFVRKEVGLNDGQVRVDYINSQEVII